MIQKHDSKECGEDISAFFIFFTILYIDFKCLNELILHEVIIVSHENTRRDKDIKIKFCFISTCKL